MLKKKSKCKRIKLIIVQSSEISAVQHCCSLCSWLWFFSHHKFFRDHDQAHERCWYEFWARSECQQQQSCCSMLYDGLNCAVCDDDRRHCRLSGTREPSAQIDSVDDGQVFLIIIRATTHEPKKEKAYTLFLQMIKFLFRLTRPLLTPWLALFSVVSQLSHINRSFQLNSPRAQTEILLVFLDFVWSPTSAASTSCSRLYFTLNAALLDEKWLPESWIIGFSFIRKSSSKAMRKWDISQKSKNTIFSSIGYFFLLLLLISCAL